MIGGNGNGCCSLYKGVDGVAGVFIQSMYRGDSGGVMSRNDGSLLMLL